MSEQKDYKYKLSLDNKIRNIRRIYGDTSRMNMEVSKMIIRANGEQSEIRGVFKPTLNLRVKTMDVGAGKKTCSEYGEFIAYKILEKMGIPSCKVDILKRYMVNPCSKSGKGNEVPGVISYIDLKPGETLVNSMTIVSRFRERHKEEFADIINPLGLDNNNYMLNPDNSVHNNNIEIIIPAFMYYVKEECGGTDEQAEQIKQCIIDMVTFDCKFANRDRHDENYGLAVMHNKAGFRFYPLYDNEYILGLSEITADIGKYSAARLQEHLNKDLYSVMGISSQPTKLSSSAMMTYLFSTFPKETQEAYKKVMSFTEEDLIKLMDECEGLPDEHKAYAARIFRIREKEMQAIHDEYIDREGNTIIQILPGNKPMELVKNAGESKSHKGSKDTSKVKDDSKSDKQRQKKKAPSLDD